MLYLTRKPGQTIVINGDIEIQVVDIKGGAVRLGVTFPPDVSVLRKELFDKVVEQNKRAAMGEALPDEAAPRVMRTKKMRENADEE